MNSIIRWDVKALSWKGENVNRLIVLWIWSGRLSLGRASSHMLPVSSSYNLFITFWTLMTSWFLRLMFGSLWQVHWDSMFCGFMVNVYHFLGWLGRIGSMRLGQQIKRSDFQWFPEHLKDHPFMKTGDSCEYNPLSAAIFFSIQPERPFKVQWFWIPTTWSLVGFSSQGKFGNS